MKFAIRDDDLNFFYSPELMEKSLKDMLTICPFSMSVVPFVMGNWIENRIRLEKCEPGMVPDSVYSAIRDDKVVHPIDKNKELVQYIKSKIQNGQIYLTFHGETHRNCDRILPDIGKNYSIGAEFYTNRDLTSSVRTSVEYLEAIFSQNITVFTPPQNIYNDRGFQSIAKNKLNICARPIQRKRWMFHYLKYYGANQFVKVVLHRLTRRKTPFPNFIEACGIKIMDHRSLQPGSDVESIYSDIKYVHEKNGNFVLSTHSCGFSEKMGNSNMTMGEQLKEILMKVQRMDNVKFVKLDEVFL
jgi:hypothetical protein